MNERISGFSYLLEAWIKNIFYLALGVGVVGLIYNTDYLKKSKTCFHDISNRNKRKSKKKTGIPVNAQNCQENSSYLPVNKHAFQIQINAQIFSTIK